jgi:hypothetical protein
MDQRQRVDVRREWLGSELAGGGARRDRIEQRGAQRTTTCEAVFTVAGAAPASR